jgi:steroid 5-alpha reductase family enzyme
MDWLGEAAVLLALALAVSSLGFYRLVYFVSTGYAFSITGMSVLVAARWGDALDVGAGLHVALLGLYGVRLGGYLLLREQEPAYRRELEVVQRRAVGVGRGKQVLIWVGVAVLYVLMFSPGWFNVVDRRLGLPSTALTLVGVAIMAAGLLLEAWADHQKSAAKRARPDRFCDVGLYRVVRCPNYLGEVVFWVGSFLAGWPAYHAWWQVASAGVGLMCIVLIMMGSTKRLEAKQQARYGQDEAYQRYVRTVPVLFPLVPVYSLRNVRVFLE